MEGLIEVYSDWGDVPTRLGTLGTDPGRSGKLFDFTFADDVLADSVLASQTLDPG
jgi:hypothetical protein